MGKKIVAIDAGHGIHTAGKRCLSSIDPNETREWSLNNRVAVMVQEMLASYDVEVLRTDDTSGVTDEPLGSRVTMANVKGADIFISIHHNAGINGGNGGGTVVYYSSAKEERKRQANTLYGQVVQRTGLVGNRAEKIIKKDFYVLVNTKMPALLLENGFMDSERDTPIILTDEHAMKTANGIVAFLVEELGLSKTDTNSQQIIDWEQKYKDLVNDIKNIIRERAL